MATNTGASGPSSGPLPHYPENPSAFPMEGGCSCGQIRYRIEQPPLVVHCCHCTACQRETGTAFAINLIIESASVTALGPAAPTTPAYPGEPDIFPSAGPAPAVSTAAAVKPIAISIPSESGDGQTIMRCPTCLVAVWSDYSSGDVMRWVRGGTLDRAWLVAPDVHIFMKSKRDFIAPGDGKPQFESYYDRNEVWRKGSLERYAKIRPEIVRYLESLK